MVASRTVWTVLLLAVSVGTGAIVACYWLAPHTVARALRTPWADWAAGTTIYGIAAAVLADMLWVRRKFCATSCPYGALMGLLADQHTLAARYLDERDDDCIRCGKCVTACPTGIDIKRGVGQFACIGCGECVDACNDVLGKRGKPGLIEFRYGLAPERHARTLSVPQRWGLWDSKRYAVVAALVLCLGAVGWSLYGHMPLTASIIANGTIARNARAVSNTYSLTLTNGTPDAQVYFLAVTGLPRGGAVSPASLTLPARGERTLPVTVSAPAVGLPSNSRTPIRLRVRAEQEQARVATIFYTPAPEGQ